ncbi:thiamine-phosphate kinase [Advenella sp. RU8]|uniref:thiamine-phosphate kinase n=1 Tax=Advenella sp. RU8 TaxID=3399575 RepID=UPI003AAB91BA
MAGEFDLIRQFFTRSAPTVLVGVGDDCAVFDVPAGAQLATSTDLLLEGRHFFSDVDPFKLGHKALAVNLSDLGAMGAKPIGCLLGLGLPNFNAPWLERFSAGFHELAAKHGCPLIGGDTTRSEQGIVISVTVFGSVSPPFLTRGSAHEGDDIWVSGALGAADVALALLMKAQQGETLSGPEQGLLQKTRAWLEMPVPRVELGLALRNLAYAVIDISDGLLQDLNHILQASNKGALLYVSQIPVNPAIAGLDQAQKLKSVLGGGDVYELCFTAPVSAREKIRTVGDELGISLSMIGSVTTGHGLKVLDEDLIEIRDLPSGFDHFR